MYRPVPPPRSGPDKDLILGIVVFTVFIVIAAGVAGWFLFKDTIFPAAPPPAPVTFSTELQKAYTTFYEKGDLQNGISLYKNLTQQFPNEAAAWREYAVATSFVGTGPYSNTIGLLQKATQLNPQDSLSYYYLTNAYYYNQKYTEAAEASVEAAKTGQGSWSGHAAVARYAFSMLDYQTGQAELEAVQKNAGASVNDPSYNLILAFLLLSNNDCTQALKVLDVPLNKWPNLAYPKILKAQCLLNDPDPKKVKTNQPEAFDLILEAQRLQPNASSVYSILATYYSYYASDPVSAEKYVQKYKNIEPDDIFTPVTLASIARSNSDYDQSIKYYQDCLKPNSKNWVCSEGWAWTLLYQGINLAGQGKDQEATVAYQAALDKALSIQNQVDYMPEKGWGRFRGYYYYLLGNIVSCMDDTSAAITYYEKAVSEPVEAYVYAYLGWAYINNDQIAEAQAAYDKGKAIDPDDSYIKELGTKLDDLNKNG